MVGSPRDDRAFPRRHLGFFEELGAEKSGWAGAKRWESEFSEMHLSAENRGDGVVVLGIYMQWPPQYEEEREGVLHVRADELPRFAEQMGRLLRLKRGKRFQRLRPVE